ncbi:MAG: HAD-IIB family hydrolase [Deltaproteobacteria bacterium]|nr:HAD-IIB family hydrolase [Deltaproteobacteria bacterium]
MAKIIIFTDLDATLLHPKTYSFDEARPALKQIREKGIPLVLCSSKTRAEIEVYRKRLDNEHPFVSENGGGIFIPEGYFQSITLTPSLSQGEREKNLNPRPLGEGGRRPGEGGEGGWKQGEGGECETIAIGAPYWELRSAFLKLKQELNAKVIGFGDMTAREIAALSGLTEEEATLAKERDFGEPFIFEGETDDRFLKTIEERGLQWTQGRFFHIMGENDKGKAVKILKHLYGKAFGEVITIGLGDGFNDLPFLKEVDYPVLIPREDGKYDPRVELPNLIKAKGIGPSGWNEEVLSAIKGLTNVL